jgi:hypothetical protein
MLFLITTACTKSKSYILHTYPPTPQVYQIPNMEQCRQSGIIVNNNQITEYYDNCGVFLKRPLMEREKKQWP